MKSNIEKLLFVLLLLLLLLLSGTIQSQSVVWQKSYWLHQEPNGAWMDRWDSGEDWWYDINLNANQTKYIYAGYSTFPNFEYKPSQYSGCSDWGFSVINDNPEPYQMESVGHLKSLGIGLVGITDLNGVTNHLMPLVEGELYSAIPTSDGGILAVGRTGASRRFHMSSTGFGPSIPYNPTLGSISDVFSISDCPGKYKAHAVVVKLAPITNIIQWIYLYGIEDYSPSSAKAWFTQSYGFGIVEKDNGNFLMVGSAVDFSTSPGKWNPFMVEMNSDGLVLNKELIGNTGDIGYAKAIVKNNDEYYVSGMEYSGSSLDAGIFLKKYSNVTASTRIWERHISSAHVGKSMSNDDLGVNSAGKILLPVGQLCKPSFAQSQAGMNKCGESAVYTIHPVTGTILSETNFGQIQATDLKIGVTGTPDGGFAVVTTKKLDELNYNPTALATMSSKIRFLENSNTDAFVAKCSSNGAIEWSRTFDSETPSPSGGENTWQIPDMNNPDLTKRMRDVKRQECLYDIVPSPNGGLTIAGNNSHNFDDSYTVKVSNDCHVQLNDHNLRHIVGVNSSQYNTHNYVGKTIVAGNSLFIAGSGLNVELKAAVSVILKPGFLAEGGSYFIARINNQITCNSIKAQNSGNPSHNREGKTILKEEILEDELGVKIYPNPNNGQFTIKLSNNEEKASVVVYDIMGKVIYSKNTGVNIQRIDITNQPKGIYLVKVKVGEQVFNKKVIYQ